MLSNADQFSNATKATLDAQLAAMSELANKSLHTVTELVELNIATVKASLASSSAAAQQILTAKDAQEVLSLSTAQAQPNAEKALAYARQLAAIAAKAQAELTKATESRVADTTRQMTTLIDDLAKTAPAGSENAVAMLKASMVNASSAYEQIAKASKQAIETIEENVSEASKHFVPAATDKPARAKKAA
jgi:phasin family protein